MPHDCKNVAERCHKTASTTADDSMPDLNIRLSGATRPVELTLVQPANGTVTWMSDRAAAKDYGQGAGERA